SPSGQSLLPIFLPKKSYARRNHSPSQPCSSTVFDIFWTSPRARAASAFCPLYSAILAYSGPMCTNMPAMNTDLDVRPVVLVVVEPAAQVIVAALGERLILGVRAAVRKLRGGDIDDAFASALRHEVHEAEQILIRIAEAHAAPNARLEIRGATRHVEGDHALV